MEWVQIILPFPLSYIVFEFSLHITQKYTSVFIPLDFDSCSLLPTYLRTLPTYPTYMPYLRALPTYPTYVPYLRALPTCPTYVPYLRALPTYPTYIHTYIYLHRHVIHIFEENEYVCIYSIVEESFRI